MAKILGIIHCPRCGDPVEVEAIPGQVVYQRAGDSGYLRVSWDPATSSDAHTCTGT